MTGYCHIRRIVFHFFCVPNRLRPGRRATFSDSGARTPRPSSQWGGVAIFLRSFFHQIAIWRSCDLLLLHGCTTDRRTMHSYAMRAAWRQLLLHTVPTMANKSATGCIWFLLVLTAGQMLTPRLHECTREYFWGCPGHRLSAPTRSTVAAPHAC